MPTRVPLDFWVVGTLLLGAGCTSGQTNVTDSPTPEPTSEPTAEAVVPTCDYVRLAYNDTSSELGSEPIFRAPGTCWNNRETGTSDMFECSDEGLTYTSYLGVNCLNNGTSEDVSEGFVPIDSMNSDGKAVMDWMCGVSDCWVEVTYFNVTGEGCPITYQMDRSSYTLNSCTYNVELEKNTLWECCEGGGVRLSVFDGDDEQCAADANVQIFEGEDSDDEGGSTCADFNEANPAGDSDIEWRCNGQTVECFEVEEDSEETTINGTQIALIVVFTLLAFAGCIYCVYSGQMINKGGVEDDSLLAEKQPNYDGSGIKA